MEGKGREMKGVQMVQFDWLPCNNNTNPFSGREGIRTLVVILMEFCWRYLWVFVMNVTGA